MTYPTGDSSNIGSVTCGDCGKRFEAQLQEQAGEVLCPDCFATVRVPALSEVAQQKSEPVEEEAAVAEVEKPPSDSYSLAATEADERPQRPPKPKRRRRAKLACEECGAALTPELRAESYNFTCPDCLSVNVVPSAVDAPQKKKKRKRPRPSAAPDFEEVGTIPPEREYQNVFDAMSEVRREDPDPPPKSTFFTNVFQLPWRRDVLAKWIMVSVGFAALGFFVALINYFIADGTILAIPFIFLPTVFIALGTMSYAVSGFLTIVEDTANGMDKIAGWNDGSWRDVAGDAIPPMFLLSLSAGASFGIARGFAAGIDPTMFWPAFGVSLCLLSPIMLLSTLQAGSIWALLTVPVLKTVVTNLWHWGVFYALVLAVAGVYAVPVYFALRSGAVFSTLILTGPLLAGCIFIIARLTGRLAWRILIRDEEDEVSPPEDEETRPKKRRKRPTRPADNSPPRSALMPEAVTHSTDGFD